MNEFIYSNLLMSFQYYGIIVRLDVIFIDNQVSFYVVTKRTCNNQDEETFTFNTRTPAFVKFNEVISHECNFQIVDLLKH